MTTKDKIKALISIDRVISQAIGHSENSPGVDEEMLQNLINTREKLEAVIFALCDELPEHFADNGKMMNGGPSVILCAKEATK